MVQDKINISAKVILEKELTQLLNTSALNKRNITKKQVKKFCTLYFSLLEQEILNGNSLVFKNIGVLNHGVYKRNIVRNPSTGERLAFSPKNKLSFKTSELIYDKLNKERQ